jgi:hypothetical protein
MTRWTCKDGHEIEVADMTDKHLLNAYKMLKNKGAVSPKTLAYYLTCKMPNGEMAKIAFDEEFNMLLDAPVSEFVDIFEDEIKKRQLIV